MGDWEGFNVFRVAELSGGRPLEAVTWALLQRLGLLESLALDPLKVRAFLRVRATRPRKDSNPPETESLRRTVPPGGAWIFTLVWVRVGRALLMCWTGSDRSPRLRPPTLRSVLFGGLCAGHIFVLNVRGITRPSSRDPTHKLLGANGSLVCCVAP